MKTILVCTFAVLASLGVVAQTLPAGPATPGVPIGAKYIEFDNSQLSPELGYTAIRAFVPTGSLKPICLATLSETNFAGEPKYLFCAPRFAFGQKGLLISVFFTAPVYDPLILSVTVYQEGAKRYGAPVLCQSTDGC